MMRITYWILTTCWRGCSPCFIDEGAEAWLAQGHTATKEPHRHVVCPEHWRSCPTAATPSEHAQIHRAAVFVHGVALQVGHVWAQVTLGFSHHQPTNSQQLWTNHSTFLDPVLIKQNILHPSISMQIVWNINHLHFIPRWWGIEELKHRGDPLCGILVGGRNGICLLANTELGDSSFPFHLENSEILQNVTW